MSIVRLMLFLPLTSVLVSFLSPSVSGYNSLEELPEDAIVTDEEDEGQETEVQEDEGKILFYKQLKNFFSD